MCLGISGFRSLGGLGFRANGEFEMESHMERDI